MSFGLRTWATFEGNLPKAGEILIRHETDALGDVGRTLKSSAQAKIRRFSGEAARRINVQVSGRGLNKMVEIYGELIQHFVDEYGLAPGTFPPWDVGSRLFRYVEKKGLIRNINRRAHHNYGVRRRPRRVSHVHSRRPRHIRQKIARAGSAVEHDPRSEARFEVRRTRRARTREGTTRSERSLSRERQIRRVAFLLARSIFERGIRANRWASRTLEENRVTITRDLANALYAGIAEINGV